MKRFFIVSLKHSTKEAIVFWRADNNGYTNNPFEAGIYTMEQLCSDLPYYTDDGVIVPVDYWRAAGLEVKCNNRELLAFQKRLPQFIQP